MNEQDWKLLKTLARERNVTRTAERLYITQPALSYRIRQIEQEFGIDLFVRTPNGVILTPQGEYLVEYANEMILRLGQVKEKVASFEARVKGPLRVGSSAVFASYELPQILKGFMERYPEVDIYLQTGISHQVMRMLEREEVAIAVVRGNNSWKYGRSLLSEEPVCLVSKAMIDIQKLPSLPRITYGTDTTLQRVIDEWWRLTFSNPSRDSLAADTMETCRRMVVQGLGWAILPSIGLKELEDVHILPLVWPDGTALTRKTWLCWGAHAEELPALRAFRDYVTGVFARRD